MGLEIIHICTVYFPITWYASWQVFHFYRKDWPSKNSLSWNLSRRLKPFWDNLLHLHHAAWSCNYVLEWWWLGRGNWTGTVFSSNTAEGRLSLTKSFGPSHTQQKGMYKAAQPAPLPAAGFVASSSGVPNVPPLTEWHNLNFLCRQ